MFTGKETRGREFESLWPSINQTPEMILPFTLCFLQLQEKGRHEGTIFPRARRWAFSTDAKDKGSCGRERKAGREQKELGRFFFNVLRQPVPPFPDGGEQRAVGCEYRYQLKRVQSISFPCECVSLSCKRFPAVVYCRHRPYPHPTPDMPAGATWISNGYIQQRPAPTPDLISELSGARLIELTVIHFQLDIVKPRTSIDQVM